MNAKERPPLEIDWLQAVRLRISGQFQRDIRVRRGDADCEGNIAVRSFESSLTIMVGSALMASVVLFLSVGSGAVGSMMG